MAVGPRVGAILVIAPINRFRTGQDKPGRCASPYGNFGPEVTRTERGCFPAATWPNGVSRPVV